MGGAESKSKKWETAFNAARKNLKYRRKASWDSVASKANESINDTEPLGIISEGNICRDKEKDRNNEKRSPIFKRIVKSGDKSAGKGSDENFPPQIPTDLSNSSGRSLEPSDLKVGEVDKVNDLEFKVREGKCMNRPMGGEENVNKPVVLEEVEDQNFGESPSAEIREISSGKRILSTYSSEDDSELFTDAVTSPLFSLEGSYHSADDEELRVSSESGTMSSTSKSAFTITRHRRVEVPALDSNELQLRHSSSLESNVLKKVASLTLDNALVDSRAVGDNRPKTTPQKLQFEKCDKFEGQMLVNWFVSSYPEDNLTLKMVAQQFCSHLLTAGVIQAMEEKEAPGGNQFKVDRMYFWSRSEVPASSLQYSPGKISLSTWPPHEPESNHNNNNNSILPDALYSEQNVQLEREISQLKAEIEKLKAQLEKERQTKPPSPGGSSHDPRPTHLDLSPKPKRLPLKSSPSPSRIPASKFKSPPKPSPHCSPNKFTPQNSPTKITPHSSPSKSTSPRNSSSPARSKLSTKLSFKSTPTKSTRSSSASPVQKSKSSDSITQNFLEKSCQTSPLHPVRSLSKSFESQLTCDLDAPRRDNVGDSPAILPLSPVPNSLRPSPGKLCLSLASMSLEDPSRPVSSNRIPPPPPPPMEGLESPAVPPSPPRSSIPPPPPMSGIPPPPPSPMCDITPLSSSIPPPAPMSGMPGPPPPPMPPCSTDEIPPPPPMGGMPPPPPMGGMPPPPPMPGIPPPPPMGGIPPPPPMGGIPPPPPMGGIPPPPPMGGIPPSPTQMGGIPPPPPPMGGIPPPPPSPLAGTSPPPAPHMNGNGSGGQSPTSQPQASASSTGPTPFPMPPVGGWNANRDRFRKEPVVPPRPMKPLYWTRLIVPPAPPSDVPPLWKELEEVPIENLEEFTELFSRQVTQARPVTSRRRQKTSKVQNVARLIDSKRSQNVGILAQSLHTEFSEIEAAIFNMDTSVVSLEALQQIYDARATDEEIALIRAHLASNPDLQLDKPEQFLADLADIPHFSERIACFMFEADFSDSISSIHSKLNNIKSVCQFLMKSDDLKKVIAIILSLGNFMNGGNRLRGQADGFGLEILPKLKDVKSKDNSLTLLHFIVRTYTRACENPLAAPMPVPEPGDVDRACSLVFDDVHAQLTSLARKLEVVSRATERVIRESRPDHLEPFKSKMETCTKTAKNGLTEQLENLEDCTKKFKAVMSFYQYVPKGVPAHEVTPKDLFVLWAPFCHDFKDAWKKEQDRLVKEKVKEMKKKQEERKQQVQTIKKQDSGLKARFQRMERLQDFGNS